MSNYILVVFNCAWDYRTYFQSFLIPEKYKNVLEKLNELYSNFEYGNEHAEYTELFKKLTDCRKEFIKFSKNNREVNVKNINITEYFELYFVEYAINMDSDEE